MKRVAQFPRKRRTLDTKDRNDTWKIVKKLIVALKPNTRLQGRVYLNIRMISSQHRDEEGPTGELAGVERQQQTSATATRTR